MLDIDQDRKQGTSRRYLSVLNTADLIIATPNYKLSIMHFDRRSMRKSRAESNEKGKTKSDLIHSKLDYLKLKVLL